MQDVWSKGWYEDDEVLEERKNAGTDEPDPEELERRRTEGLEETSEEELEIRRTVGMEEPSPEEVKSRQNVGLDDVSNGKMENGRSDGFVDGGKQFYSKKEAFQRFNDDGIKVSDSIIYPMDEEIAKECARWYDKFATKFTTFHQNIVNKLPKIKNVAPYRLKDGTLGEFVYYANGKVDSIRLNSGLFNMWEHAQKEAIELFARGWSSGQNPIHTFIHEYGHYVSHSMEEFEPGFEHRLIQKAIDEYKKKHPEDTYKPHIGLEDALSKYSIKNESECFAEAFAEYFGEDEPREFATIFGQLLEKELQGVKAS